MVPAMAAPGSGGVGLLERAISYTLGGLGAVRPMDLPAQTPCAEWDLRALLGHLADSLTALYEAVDPGEVLLEPDSPVVEPDRLVALLRERASRLLGAWTNAGNDGLLLVGGCPMTGRLVTAVGALEIVTHGWDIYRSVGATDPVPTLLAIELLRIAPMLAAEEDRPGRFAPPVPISASAPAADRLVAFLGRDPAWTAPRRGLAERR